MGDGKRSDGLPRTVRFEDYTSSPSGRAIALLVLGVAYKKDISDMRESPALDIIALLQARALT